MKQIKLIEQIILVSAPWPFFNRPSIQLGALKAYLNKQMPELEITANHFYLQVAEALGYDLYRNLSERTWIAECVYAALLYPEHFEKIEKLFKKQIRSSSEFRSTDFIHLVQTVKKVSDIFISDTDWGRFDLAGFSVCLCQLTSSLYLMREIKTRCPDMVILAGGSMIAESSAKAMLKVFPQLDVVIVGEGEKPLVSLIKLLGITNDIKKIPQTDGVITGYSDKEPVRFSQIRDLGEIPQPDYQEYFDLLSSFVPEKRFFPILPMEISRGCWWKSRKGPDGNKGCAFCNLNLQWKGYRAKNSQQVVSQVDAITSRHAVLSVSFMDNVIPPKQSVPIFEGLSSSKKDYQLFCELRASVTKSDLSKFRQAGVTEVQVGIEALSTGLLKKIGKGTTAIQNIEIMKHCEELSIKNASNLMICFPGSDQSDVLETLEALKYVQPYRPLKIVSFWLGLESPVYRNYRGYGLKAVFNHPFYRILFPKHIVAQVGFTIQDYRGDKAYQRKLWSPVSRVVAAWEKNYEQLHENAGTGPILGYRDGNEFMIIRERGVRGDRMNHRLRGTSRKIYLFCDHTRSIGEIVSNFHSVDENKIVAFLKMMTQKKLMFEETGHFLSLAVKER